MELDIRYIDRARPPISATVDLRLPITGIQLPVELSVGSHAVAFRTNLSESVPETMQLKLKINNHTYYDEFDVILNGHRLPAKDRTARAIFIMNNDSWVTYLVDKSQLLPGDNELVVEIRKINPAISSTPRLVGLELSKEERVHK